MIFQHPGIGDSKSVKQARDMDIPEIWKNSPGINPYPRNGGNILLASTRLVLSTSGNTTTSIRKE